MTKRHILRDRARPLAIAGVLLGLLVLLAHLQWRLIGQVSALDRHRLETALRATGARMADELDRELGRVFAALHPDFGLPPAARLEDLVDRLRRWRADAAVPGLVGAVHIVHAGRAGDAGDPALERLDPALGRFAPAAWPAELAPLAAALREDRAHGPRAAARRAGRRLVAPGLQALLIPLAFPSAPRPSPPTPAGAAVDGEAGDPLAGSYVVVAIDERALADQLLPGLVHEALSWRARADVLVSVVDPARPGHVVYRSDPAAPADPRDADMALAILGAPSLMEGLAALSPHGGPGPCGQGHGGGADCPLGAAGHGAHARARGPAPDAQSGGWTLLLRRRGSSLDQAVAALRAHNLAVSLGVLGLAAVAAITLVVASQRAQRLARQQIEFVAGVTHELHTPLTAIRAAGANLADGVAAGPDQVKRYGRLIEAEGRRLSATVSDLLELAGIQSGRREYRLEATSVDAIVDDVLRESGWLLEEAGIAVERDVAGALPQVLADGPALRRGLQNLVENAVKHGGEAGWLGVRATRAPDGGVDVTVSDRGPGIARDELARVFEPFVRGRDAAARGVPGVGLGLALVRQIARAHGGDVSVASGPDRPEGGAAFTLHLPPSPSPAPDPAEAPA